MDILSMGMSGDYPDAIREGATIVRIGTAIYGARDYTTVFIRQYRIILSADTASEVRQMPSQKRR